MRFIKNVANPMAVIAGEMLNIECGKKIFDNGVLIPGDRHGTYPDIQHEGVRTIITTNYGIIYIPVLGGNINGLLANNWVINLKNTVSELTGVANHLLKKYGRLDSYECIDTGECGFTSTKAKHNSYGNLTYVCNTNRYISIKNLDRVIWVFPDCTEKKLATELRGNRFTWMINDMDSLITTAVNNTISPNPSGFVDSYISICYDVNNVFDVQDVLKRDLIATDLKSINEIVPIHSFGLIDKKFVKLSAKCFKGEIKKRKDVRTQLASIVSMIPKAQFDYNIEQSVPTDVYTNHQPLMVGYKLIFHKKLKGGFELIRQLGLWKVYINLVRSNHIKTHRVDNSLVVNLSHVEIDNTVFPQKHKWDPRNVPRATTDELNDFETETTDELKQIPVPNDRCWHCHTPLCGKIYMAFDKNSSSNRGVAICGVCVCLKFDTSGLYVIRTWDMKPLITDNMRIAQTTFPRTTDQVIDRITVDKVQEIVRSMFTNAKIITAKRPKDSILNQLSVVLLTTDDRAYVGVDSISNYACSLYDEYKFKPTDTNVIEQPSTAIIPMLIV